jgi:hypothetical protein
MLILDAYAKLVSAAKTATQAAADAEDAATFFGDAADKEAGVRCTGTFGRGGSAASLFSRSSTFSPFTCKVYINRKK